MFSFRGIIFSNDMCIRNGGRMALLALAAAALALAQAPASSPAFEVATIKPSPPLNPLEIAQGKVHLGMRIDGARVDIGAFSIADLIRIAWEVKAYQVSGPEWMTTERFNILAKMPEDATKDQVPRMLQALLAERFKLAIHKENRDHPVYALIVGKNGPKLETASPPASEPQGSVENSPSAKNGTSIETSEGTVRIARAPDGKSFSMNSPKTGAAKMTMGSDGLVHMDMDRVTMSGFADILSRYLDRPVLDKTNLKGEYHASLDFSIQEMLRIARLAGMVGPGMGPMGPPATLAAEGASDPGGGGSVFNAVQRLGLKLDPKKESVETIVVDHVEKAPIEN